MVIKIVIDTSEMTEDAKSDLLNGLEKIASRDISDLPVYQQTKNIFDARPVGKNLYYLFGELVNEELQIPFRNVISWAMSSGAKLHLDEGGVCGCALTYSTGRKQDAD